MITYPSIELTKPKTDIQVRRIPLKVTFIVPCFNEKPNIEPFCKAFSDVFDQAASNLTWELVFVDDGSTDGTFDAIGQTSSHHCKNEIKAVKLTRNFGKEAAIWAGLKNADGDVVGIIDADLQQPPKDALNMVEILIDNPGVDCVAAYQKDRKGGKLHSLFYSVMGKLCGLDMIKDASDFRVFRRIVADTMLSMPEVHRFTKGMFAWMGFTTTAYPYTPNERHSGDTKWSKRGLFKYAAEGIFSYSTVPLSVATAIGTLISVAALTYFVYLIIKTILLGVDLPGFPTITALILLLGGMQLIFLGIIGKYLGNAYMQGKQRPIAIVREVVSNQDDSPSRR